MPGDISKAGIEKIRQAQLKRWARWRRENGVKKKPSPAPVKKKTAAKKAPVKKSAAKKKK